MTMTMKTFGPSGAFVRDGGFNNASVVDLVSPDMLHLIDPQWYVPRTTHYVLRSRIVRGYSAAARIDYRLYILAYSRTCGYNYTSYSSLVTRRDYTRIHVN